MKYNGAESPNHKLNRGLFLPALRHLNAGHDPYGGQSGRVFSGRER